MENSTFEYSTADADIDGKIDSVMNPAGGIIRADRIDELILEKDKVDTKATKVICRSRMDRKCPIGLCRQAG